jgi:O-antigen ligase
VSAAAPHGGAAPIRLRLGALSLACLVCGGLMQAKFGLELGDLVVGEPLLFALGLGTFLLFGMGRSIPPALVFWSASAAGLMLLGYLLSDLFSDTNPEQYVRGWARVAVLAADLLALYVVVSHGARHLWWFALGLALGMLIQWGAGAPAGGGSPTTTGPFSPGAAPFSMMNFKEGLGLGFAILAALAAGFLGRSIGALLLATLGALTVLLDFRSLGAGLLVCAALFAFMRRFGSQQARLWRALLTAAGLAVAAALLAVTLAQGDSQVEARRDESNLNRYVGMSVAWRAIADSPFLGYGSWSGDKAHVDLLNQELFRAAAGTDIPVTRTESLLPHSQLLQAWIEGGFLAALFFLFYGWQALRSLAWLALHHAPGRLTPLYLLFIVTGLWDLAASPFLGSHRVSIECAMAAMALLAGERLSPWRSPRSADDALRANTRRSS